jgi:hypothetical protein
LVHLYVLRGILGNRVQVFAPDAAEFLQPFLTALDLNQPHAGIKFRATTSYEQVVERRGAELIIRLASNIQFEKDALKIISHIGEIDFLNCDKNFIDQAQSIAKCMFDLPANSTNELAMTVNQSKMVITKDTCEEALQLFIKVLMPQHFMLMNYRVSIETAETPSELHYETKILKLPYRIFYKTTLFGNQGVLKNVPNDELEHLLTRLVRRNILTKGNFLKSSNQDRIYDSYLKRLPADAVEQKKIIFELKKHNMELEEYRTIYKNSLISPYGTTVTGDGDTAIKEQNIDFILIDYDQPMHPTPIHTNSADDENSSNVDICTIGGK